MKTMIDGIFAAIPTTTIILSTLAKSRVSYQANQCAENLSKGFALLVASYPAETRIHLADFNSIVTLDQIQPLKIDGVHPTDDGYKLFAAVWWDAISKMQDKIQPPAAVKGLDDSAVSAATTCNKVAGNAPPAVQIQQGSGHDNGMYHHEAVSRGVIPSARSESL
jgi:hypothetical protein